MNKLEQAARQILEALEGLGLCSDYWNEKVTALCEALAEPMKQELVCKTCESLARTVMMDQTGKA